jgi:hypothetical protein
MMCTQWLIVELWQLFCLLPCVPHGHEADTCMQHCTGSLCPVELSSILKCSERSASASAVRTIVEEQLLAAACLRQVDQETAWWASSKLFL